LIHRTIKVYYSPTNAQVIVLKSNINPYPANLENMVSSY